MQVLGNNMQVKHQWTNRWSSRSGVDVYYDRVQSRRTDIDETTNASTSKRGLYPDGSTMLHYAAYVNNRRVADVAYRLTPRDLSGSATLVLRSGKKSYALARFL